MPDAAAFTKRAIQLASYGIGFAAPNPLVAWVFVRRQQIIKEGWLTKGSLASALSADIKDINLSGSSLYMNINPLSIPEQDQKKATFSDILTQHQVHDITVPDTESATSSATRALTFHFLPSLKDEADCLNRRYFTWNMKKRPYIILKWAETSDGFIARENHDSKWISNTHSRKLVHQWRSQEDAIMAGTNTCRYDNPKLNVRDWTGKNPIRIIPDKNLNLSPNLHVFDQSQPTICYNQVKTENQYNLSYVAIPEDDPAQFMSHLLYDLYQRKIQSMLVEGGAQLLSSLIRNGWWDEARIFQSGVVFHNGIKAPLLDSAELVQEENISGDRLLLYQKLNKK